MDQDNANHLETIFFAALDIHDPEARASYLTENCGQDAELRQRVEQMLAIQSKVGSFMENPPVSFDGTIELDKKIFDAGLTAGLRADQAVVIGSANHSVLKSLSRSLNEMPRVMLRDPKEVGIDPIIRPRSKEIPADHVDSRYQLAGEIARGGMGAIIKGRDVDLGRDLAIKVLLDSHKDKPEVVQRFIEEAQIGGQLQHPGIVPVYELGQFGDQRPFFSMKLVKGQTLAQVLAARKHPSEDRAKYLGIFEQICQTMAYAHSRGVIHRDLKPANIMIGAFGEVQVMDWGLAKVLSVGGIADEKRSLEKQTEVSIIRTLRSVGSDSPGSIGSQTQMGSVMGTPAYMSPEQALGEVDRLDERTDVFGLGAILCEILTGKPPYVASCGEQVFRLASRGKLEDCHARLNASQVATELLQVAHDALALEPDDRLRDAGALSKRFSDYLQSVESRLRQAEVERHQAITRAEEVRKRQRVMFALAGSVVITIGVAAGAWSWVQNKNAQLAQVAFLAEQKIKDEQAKLVGEIKEKIATARAVRGDFSSPSPHDYQTSVRALASAKQAQTLAEKSNVETALSQEVRALVRDIELEVRDQRLAIDLDDAWSKEMEKLAEGEYFAGNVSSKPISDQAEDRIAKASTRLKMAVAPEAEPIYANAFAAWGIEPGKTSEAEAVRRIQELPVEQQATVLVALERWQELLSTPSVTQWNSANWQVLRPTEMKSGDGATLSVEEDGSIISDGDSNSSITITAPWELERLSAIRLETIPDARSVKPGRLSQSDFRLAEFRVTLGSTIDSNVERTLRMTNALSDYEIDQDRSIVKAFDGDRDTAWLIKYEESERHMAVFEFQAIDAHSDGNTVRIRLENSRGPAKFGRFRLSVTEEPIGPSPHIAWLASVINQADRDEWRRQLRREIDTGDIAALIKRSEAPELVSQPLFVQIRLAEALRQVDDATILNLWKSQVKWLPLKPIQLESSSGATLDVTDDGTIVLNSLSSPCDSYTLTASIDGNIPKAIRIEIPAHPHRVVGNSGWPYCFSEFEVSLVENSQADPIKTEHAALADNASKIIQTRSVDAASALGSGRSVSSSGLPQVTDEVPLMIESGIVDYEMSPYLFSASFDQDNSTFWKANSVTNKPHTLVYWLNSDTPADRYKTMRLRLHSGEDKLMHYAPRHFKVFVSNDRTKPPAPLAAAISILRQLQRERPGDFWSNYALSHALFQNGSQSREEALRFATAAVALRPKGSESHANVVRVLGRGLEWNTDLSMRQLAIHHARIAKELNPKNQFSNQLSVELATKGFNLRGGNQHESSISCFRLALELDPMNVRARQGLAQSLNDVGQQAEAVDEFRKVGSPLWFGLFLQRIGKLDDAEKALRNAVEFDPLVAYVHEKLANVLALQGKTEEATVEESKAKELEQKERESSQRLDRTRGPTGSGQEVVDETAALRLALATNPNDLQALSRLVLLLEKTKQVEQAIALLQSHMEMLQDKPFFIRRLGNLLHQENRIDEAIEMYRKSIELGDVSYVTYESAGEVALDSIGEIKSRYANNHARLGNALDTMGKHYEAQEHYQRALEYDPFAAERMTMSWDVRDVFINRFLADFESAIRLQPRLVEAHIGMGWALAVQGKADAARAKFREAIELAPKFAYVQNDLAWNLATHVNEKLRDPELAVEVATRACSFARKREAYEEWNTLGVSQYYAGNYAAAVEALQRSIELRDQEVSREVRKVDRSLDWFFMAMAHWQLGDQSVALEYFDKAVVWMKQNDPRNPELIRFKAEAAALLSREQEAPEASSDKPDQSPLSINDPPKGNVR